VIYLDHMASTPLDPEVRDAMLPWLEADAAGNPHSQHPAGWRAAKAVEAAQAAVAELIGARASEIVFVSGATEANNLAIHGASRVIVSPIEHPSVLEPAGRLRRSGTSVETVPVDRCGRVDLQALDRLLAHGPALVSVMAANNEVGTIEPVAEIGALCRRYGARFHTDAAQALSTQAIDVERGGIDLLSLSGHKLYGPIGIGALYVRSGESVQPLLHGGGQQRGRRAGTVSVALAVGLGTACRLALQRRAADGQRLATLRDRLFAKLRQGWQEISRNGPATDVLPACLNVTVPGVDAADLLLDVPELAVSTGSACATLTGEPSHVLRAIGLSAADAHASLRFGLGRYTTETEVDAAAAQLNAALRERARPA
jgi:cysteine desulfurase